MNLIRDIFRRISGNATAVTKRLKSFAIGSGLMAAAIVLAAGLSSCARQTGISKTLSDVESFINERPDSALTVLQEIDPENIHGRGTDARYAMLMSKSLDKNYVDLTTDSLITIAVNYYDRTKDYDRKFQSYYYLGRVYYNAGNYVRAMLAYTKAEQLVDRVDDYYGIALLYSHIGILHSEFYDFQKSLDAHRKAHDYFAKSGDELLSMVSQINLGHTHLRMHSFEEAEKCLTQGMKWAYAHQYNELCQECVEGLLLLYEQTNQHDKISDLYESDYYKICQDDLILNNFLAFKNATERRPNDAARHLAKAWEYAETAQDTVNMHFYQYLVQKTLGNYKEALESHEVLMFEQDTILRTALQQPIISAQKDYFESQSEYSNLQLRHARQSFILSIAIIFLIIALIAVYIYKNIKVKKLAIGNYMEKVDSLEESLFSERQNADERESQINEMKNQISELFSKQFELIDRLCRTYYENPGKAKQAIADEVEKTIRDFGDDRAFIAQLEDIVNKYRNNVMALTRETVPFLQEMEYRLLCYFYAGFSTKTISVFTGDNVGNLKVKKLRLRKRIAESDSKNKDIILAALG